MQNEELVLRNYAHIGDAVWELFVRNYTVKKTANAKMLHKITTDRVNAKFQMDMLGIINEYLSDEELDFAKRARNIPIPVGRRNIQSIYRQSTAFEALIGYWYLHDNARLEYFYEKLKDTEFFN